MENKKKRTNIMPFFVIALVSMCFLSVISYYILLGSYYDIRSQYISVVNEQVIEEIETSVNFGKSLNNYYGIDKILEKATSQLGEGYDVAILNRDGVIRYSTFGKIGTPFDITERDRKVIRQDITDESGNAIGTFATVYDKASERSLVSGELSRLRNITGFAALLVSIITIAVMLLISRTAKKPVRPIVAVIILAMTVQSAFLINIYQGTYKDTVIQNAQGIGSYIAVSLKEIEDKGVPIDKIDGLQEYLNEKTDYDMIAGIQLQKGADKTAGAEDSSQALENPDGFSNETLTFKLDGASTGKPSA